MNHVDLSERSLHIHVVIACRAQRDHFHTQFIQPVNDRRVYSVVHKNTDRIAVSGQIDGILVQLCFQKTKLNIVLTAIVLK